MGGREVGALANQLAAHMDFAPTDLDRVRRFWRAPNLATRPGLKAVDLFRAVGSGQIKAIWIMATNPVVSLPDSDAVRTALSECPLVVVSDGARTSETVRYADILLPTLLWSERDGTVTNSERRISRQRAFRPPPAEAKADWWILAQVATRLGFGDAFGYRNAAHIFREHAALSAFENSGERDFDLGAIATLDDGAYARLEPTLWPVRVPDAKPVERLFGEGGFFTDDRRASLVAVVARPPVHAPDPAFPLVLNTGRVRDQWHTMTRTAIPRLMEHTPEPFVAVHPDDATLFDLANGELVHVDSRWGSATLPLQISTAQRRGEIFVPMHWSWPLAMASAANRAVNPAADPLSGQPELKHTPVRLTPFRAAWRGTVMTREAIDLGALDYSAAIPGRDHWQYEIAGGEPLAEAWGRFIGRFDQFGWHRTDLRDASLGHYRAAWFNDDRLEACVLLGRGNDLPLRRHLASFFAGESLPAADRNAVLAGRSAGAVPDEGPIICICHGVSRNRIDTAVTGGAATLEALGAALKAGTNCGSCIPELRQILSTARPCEVT
jgi:assimilatory nitrate reductase catalytic subunit